MSDDKYEHDYYIIRRLIDSLQFEKFVLMDFLVERNLLGEWEEWCNERKFKQDLH